MARRQLESTFEDVSLKLEVASQLLSNEENNALVGLLGIRDTWAIV